MGIPASWEICIAGQEATVRTEHGTMDQFHIGKGVRQGCILSPCLCNLCSSSCEMLSWMKHKLELRFLGEISIISDMQITLPLCTKRRETKEPLDEGEQREWKSWLKTQYSKKEDPGIWSHYFMSNREQQWKLWQTFFVWALKSQQMVTAAIKFRDPCFLEEKLWPT